MTPDPRQIMIVGANGAGKTRFAGELAALCGERAYKVNVLSALFDQSSIDTSGNSIDSMYERAFPPSRRNALHSTQLERMLALLMHEEMINLFRYKASLASQGILTKRSGIHPPGTTLLDRVINMWQEIFPDNRILTENGEILFESVNGDAYNSVRLSTGEKAVIYYIGAVLYAPSNSVVFVENPELFLHPSLIQAIWNRIEQIRRDCTFVYTTHDIEFATSRGDATMLWVQSYDAAAHTWEYQTLEPGSTLADELYLSILGSRKPVLFIEGDATHSIDAKLYPLIFKDYAVQSLGSCNKVIEATRTFNDLNGFHHLDSRGIVDRDRRDAHEVEYLRRKRIMVPDVAEIENILMLEDVIRTVATHRHKDGNRIFAMVSKRVISLFAQSVRTQALQHTRHRLKRIMEYRIDGRFSNINMLEQHLSELLHEINPRSLYNEFCTEFSRYVKDEDYVSVLRVFNDKTMLSSSNVATLCGLRNKDEYIRTILDILRADSSEAERIRTAITGCFGLDKKVDATQTADDNSDTALPRTNAKRDNTKKRNRHDRNRKKQSRQGMD